MGNVPIVTSKGKIFDVEDIYLKPNIKQPDIKSINNILLNTILESIKNDNGDLLVFLAGVKEIKSIQNLLESKLKNSNISIYPLYSNLQKKRTRQCNKKK